MEAPRWWELAAVFLVLLLAPYMKSILQTLYDLQRQLRFTRGIRGPPTLPLIGSSHLFVARSAQETFQFLSAEAKKVAASGGHMMKVWLGLECNIWLLDSEAAKVVLGSTKEISKGPSYAFITRLFGRGLLAGNGDVWRSRRKIVTPAFHFSRVDDYARTMEHHIRILIELLNKQPPNEEIDLYLPLKYSALDVICDTAMGFEMNSQLQKEDCFYPKAVEEFSQLAWIQFQRPHYLLYGRFLWRLLGYEAQTVKTLDTLKATSRRIIKQRLEALGDEGSPAEGEEKRRQNFLDLLLGQQHENRLTAEELGAEVDTFVFAGHDTVAHAVAWAVWCLATHPDIQERCYAELIVHFGQSDGEFATKKIHELPFLDACFKETMRIRPPVPFFQRRLENDLVVDGHTIPRHTPVVISPLLMHHNEQVFPNPHRFDPERFLGDREFAANSYVPFSAGSRNCIGQRFAQREVLIMIAHLVYNFELSSDYRFEENIPIPETITKPSLGIPFRLKSRHA
ncbi:CRE-CYP-29A2 protein [Aphelenchoides fujianensis]|nr:CRE-CYP-29A2 protein [Aphelenchoides fujianensis]